ncbi:MAG: hypothetical protein AB7W47_00175 [Calditrichaceae bacterium]
MMSEKQDDLQDSWQNIFWKSHKYNERTKIKSGTYLNSFCPHCLKELTIGNKLYIELVRLTGETGQLALSPYLNSFEHFTTIKLTESEEAKDFRCPHCHKSLVVTTRKCAICKSSAASFLIGSPTLKVPFFICTKISCHWHALSPEHEKLIMIEDSDEW